MTQTPPDDSVHLPPPRTGVLAVTLADVAKVAGVSKITASRALSNPAVVTPETRNRVLEAVRVTGYVPNLIAAGFKSNRSRLIACLVPTIAPGSAFLPAVQAMSAAFAEAGFQVLLGERGYDPAREAELIDAAIARRPDGIVVTGILQSRAARENLSRSGIPVVEAWDMTEKPIDMLVGFSHYKAGQAVATYLHTKGRRNVALIASTEPRGAQRARGFTETACRLGISVLGDAVPTHTEGAPTRMRHGRAGFAALLRDHPQIDAICCSTDLVALGALIEARSAGVSVPERVAIVGFGDLDFAADTDPALTTLRVDNEAIGREAAMCIMNRIRGGGAAKVVREFELSLIERSSA